MAEIIGITGGIASGKSSLVSYLRKQSYRVIDSDQVVRRLQKKGGKLYRDLVVVFGDGILKRDGELDRQKIRALFHVDEGFALKLGQVQDDIIRAELARLRDNLADQEELFFMDIPLLFELNYQSWFDKILLVDVDPETQLNRLMKRDQLAESEAKIWISSQLPLEVKRRNAHVLLDNHLEMTRMITQVKCFLNESGSTK